MEFIEMFQEYIVLVVLGICLCVGYIIKHSLEVIPNKHIPLILGVLGVIVNIWANHWVFTPEVLLSGLVSGLGAVGMHQVYKNNKEE